MKSLDLGSSKGRPDGETHQARTENLKKIEAAQEAEDRADNKKKYGTYHVPRHLRYIDPDSEWEIALET